MQWQQYNVLDVKVQNGKERRRRRTYHKLRQQNQHQYQKQQRHRWSNECKNERTNILITIWTTQNCKTSTTILNHKIPIPFRVCISCAQLFARSFTYFDICLLCLSVVLSSFRLFVRSFLLVHSWLVVCASVLFHFVFSLPFISLPPIPCWCSYFLFIPH